MENYNEEENHRIGRDLNRKDTERRPPQQRYSYRAQKDYKWDEGNYFHTGPSKSGAQDRDSQYKASGARSPQRHDTFNRDSNAHLSTHYGSRPNSPYRNERSYLDHGDTYRSSDYTPQYSQGRSVPGNYNEPPAGGYETYNDVPGERSRYKEDDYRYGSGSHNWYREGRYTSDEDRPSDRGFFNKVRDTWNDIMHSDDPDYKPTHPMRGQSDRISSHHRYSSKPYQERDFNRGYEGGPRWADEIDSGKDNYYDDTDRTQRYRR